MSENTTTTLSINDTILLALTETGISGAGYESVVDKAVEKLTEREQALTEAVIELAEEAYGYGGQAKRVLSEAGLSIKPEPQPEPETATEEGPAADTDARLDRIERLIETLVAAARRNGIIV